MPNIAQSEWEVTTALQHDSPASSQLPSTWVWGLPLTRTTFDGAVAEIQRLIALGQPNYVITANIHYAMLCERDIRLREHNKKAAMVLADGMPLVWASHWRSHPLPQRVTGSDIVPLLCEVAARNNYRIYLLGGSADVLQEANRCLVERYRGLQIVGAVSPPYRTLTNDEQQSIIEDIRSKKPDLLFVAFGQPKGEYWVAQHYKQLEVPVVMQVGATLDFIASRVRRAPRWMQRIGLEWAFRFLTDPIRLGKRYAANAWFGIRMLIRDMVTSRSHRM